MIENIKKKKKKKKRCGQNSPVDFAFFSVTSRRIRVHSAVVPGFRVCSSDKRALRVVERLCCRLVSQKSKDVPRLRWHEAIFSDARCSWKTKSRVI